MDASEYLLLLFASEREFEVYHVCHFLKTVSIPKDVPSEAGEHLPVLRETENGQMATASNKLSWGLAFGAPFPFVFFPTKPQ